MGVANESELPPSLPLEMLCQVALDAKGNPGMTPPYPWDLDFGNYFWQVSKQIKTKKSAFNNIIHSA